jgi:hypothetical protein
MAVFDVTEALSYLGKTVLVELAFDDPDDGHFQHWCCVHIVGVVLALEGVYDHPHFMYLDLVNPSSYPYEMMWEDIRTVRVLESRTRSRGKRRT